MERSFLEGLNLEKDVIDQIMAENGKDINREKSKADALKTQLDEARQTLKGFEGVNVSELQGKVAQLTADLAAKESEYQGRIAEMEFDAVIDEAIRGSKARNAKAVRALLDLGALRTSKNQKEDIAAAIEAVKKENDYLFADTNVPRVVSSTPGADPEADSTKSKANEALRSLFGKE
ncbi:MAG: phage scaffolding protein [Oscillospiraceae bacterium]|nr:phage scaffolding protein [Oscillospiraceae bacterium]